jgi:hypothetical protein
MSYYNEVCLCVHCKHLRPALDPNLQKAYLGQCLKREWPFTLSITLQGVMECEVFEESGKAYVPPDPAATKSAAAAAAAKGPKRLEFYYSSANKPGETFPCDNARALELIKQLKAKGMDAKAIDVASVKDRFPIYHKAVSGPDASVRPVFGAKGALVENFGTDVPALLVFEGDRYPTVAFPRSDAKRGTVRVEQALEDLLAEAGQGVPSAASR